MLIYSIIVTYNGEKWIEKCINSLLNSDINSNIIIIDNNSSDNTVSIIENDFPPVKLIKSSVNLGFGQANNIGLKIAIQNKADYIFLLNQDAWIEVDTIRKLIDSHKLNQNYGIISPIHLTGDGMALDKGFINYSSSQFGCENFFSDLYLNKLNDIYSTKFVNAACWLITSKCLNTIGGFDPLFFHYGEDENYVQRAIFHKFKIGICPKTKIYHDRPANAPIKYDIYLKMRENLINLADVNHKNNSIKIKQELRSEFFKLIKLICQFKFYQTHETFKIIDHLFKHKDQIKLSVTQNREIGLNWIELD